MPLRTLNVLLFLAAAATAVVAYGPTIEAFRPAPAVPVALPAPVEPAPEPPAPEPVAVAPGAEIPGTEGMRYVQGKIHGSLYETLAGEIGREVADPLTQVVNRLLVWWVDPRRDLRAGDDIAVLYSLPEGEEPRLHAVAFESQKNRKTYRAYAFQPEGDDYRRFYDPDGQEIEERLEGGPIEIYEQVTSLLRDGRGHKGVDFKTPVGTPVYAPFDAVVKRRNWGFRYNGNALHLQAADGVEAIFLHLEGVEGGVRPGTRVKKGQLIATAGNTGRSTAPHLHYQLQRGKRLVDPFEYHRTHRRALGETERAAYQSRLDELDGLMRGQAEAIAAAEAVAAEEKAGGAPPAAAAAP